MCRSHADGGRLCPSQTDPVLIANRNARRRAAYAKKRTAEKTTHSMTSNISSFGNIQNEEIQGTLVDSGYISESQVSGKINYVDLNENSYKDFGFQHPDEKRKSDVSLIDLIELSKTELEEIPLGEQRALGYFTGDNYQWINTALFGENDYNSDLPPLREGAENINKVADHFSDIPYSDYNKLGPKWESSDKEITPELLKVVTSKMDDGMLKAPGKQRILYRGISSSHRTFDNYKSVADYVKENYPLGQELEFDGYQSTSYSPVIADNYANRGGGVIFEIKTPSGLNVASISHFIGEKEVLLPRSVRYTVVGVHENVTYQAEAAGDTQYEPSANTTVVQLIEVTEEGSIRTSQNFSAPPELNKSQLRTRTSED
jgi:hypothetical protein